MHDLADFYEEIGEANDDWNDEQRQIIHDMFLANDQAFLGLINLCKEHKCPVIWRYDEDVFVYNFGADFVLPRFDQVLLLLIEERVNAPYTGTQEDYQRVIAITEQITACGGKCLIWS
jgi:hypothetical protein